MRPQSAGRGGRRSVRGSSGLAGSLHHLLLHLSSLSGKKKRTKPLARSPFIAPFLTCWDFSPFLCLFMVSLSLFSFHVFYVCVCEWSQCVCTLSPSPSKLSKPLPLDSLQLPLAPGLVTHNVSLCWSLMVCGKRAQLIAFIFF